MKAGKISEAVLRRSVLGSLHSSQDGVFAGAQVGGDFSAVRLEEGEQPVLSVRPVTRVGKGSFRLGVIKALNNIACSGARPAGILASVLVPTTAEEHELRQWIKELDEAAAMCGTSVIGGHTEIIRGIREPVITLTGIGAVRPERIVLPAAAKPGMALIASRWIGLEGTAVLAREREEELRERFPGSFVDMARSFEACVSVQKEAAVAAECGALVLHDASEGGIFGALWELGQASGVGMEVQLRSIPIRQETIEICEYFSLNPYKLLSGGCLLIGAMDAEGMLFALRREGIDAVVIGYTTGGKDRVLINGEERRFLETAQTDELSKILL